MIDISIFSQRIPDLFQQRGIDLVARLRWKKLLSLFQLIIHSNGAKIGQILGDLGTCLATSFRYSGTFSRFAGNDGFLKIFDVFQRFQFRITFCNAHGISQHDINKTSNRFPDLGAQQVSRVFAQNDSVTNCLYVFFCYVWLALRYFRNCLGDSAIDG